MANNKKINPNPLTGKLSGIESANNSQKWWILLAIGIGTFMSALDTSIVNTVLPVIRSDFNTDLATIQWVVTIYLLFVSGFLLSIGRLGDLRGHKKIYLFGFMVFVFSSALCGLAASATSLIVFRAVQAFGAAMLAANSPAILTGNFPAIQRGQALGLQATMTYLGLTVAPSFGGWLTDMISWRAVFYINIPVGLTALWLSWRFIPEDGEHRSKERFDIFGSLLFIFGLLALLLGLNRGHLWGWLSIPILATMTIAAFLLSMFYSLQKKHESPLVDLSLFFSRIFSGAVVSAFLNYICIFSIMFLLPFYLLQGRELSPTQAGLILTAQPIIMAIVAPISGTLSDRIGTRIPSVLGMMLLSLGLFLISQLDQTSPISSIVLALVVTGFGTGTFISPNNSALMGSAPRHRQGIAAGILATARSLGMVIGVGLFGAIFSTLLNRYQVNYPEQAFFIAIQTSFAVSAIIALLGALIAAISGKAKVNNSA
ncbi:MAG: MFS transporter [Anaerolineales bacterium]|nr:MFS transporter [Anaerolineales bacterium]